MKREVRGLTKNGEKIFLGKLSMTDEEVVLWLEEIAEIFVSGKPGYFSIGTAVFNAQDFSGVWVI